MTMTFQLKAPALVPSVVVVAAVTGASMALLAIATSEPANTLIANGLVLLAAMTATGLFAWTARDHAHPTVWILLAAAGLAFTLAEAYWFVVEGLLQQDVPAVTFADVGYLVGYALFVMAGILALPGRLRTGVHVRLVLDFLIVFISLSAIAWTLFAHDTYIVVQGQAGAGVLLMTYPLLDLILLGLLFFMLRTAPPVHRAGVLLFALAFLSWAVVDISYASQAADEGFASGLPIDAFWVGGYAALGLAAIVRSLPRPATDRPAPPTNVQGWSGAIYVPVIVFIPVVAYNYLREGHIDGVLFTFGVLLLSTFVGRQLLFSREVMTTNRELADEKERLAQAQATARLGTWKLDLRSHQVWASKEVHRMFGRSEDSTPLDFEDWSRLVAEEARQEVLDAYARILKEDGTYERDLEFTLPDGRTKTLALHAHRAPDQSKDGALLEGTLQDITDRRNVEATNRSQALLLKNITEGLVATDLEGTVTYWNESAEDLFGWTSKEAVGRPIVDLWGAQYTQEAAPEKPGKGPVRADHWLPRKDGSTVLAQLTTSPMLRDDQALAGFIAIIDDVTEQRQTSRRYQDLVEDSPFGIFRTTPKGEFEYVNQAGAQMFGYDDPPQLMAELGPVENMYADPSDWKILLTELAKDHPKPLEFQFRRRDGTRFWGEARVTAQTGEDGRPVIEGTLRDLTAERERHASNSLLAAIVMSSHEALYSKDLDGVIQTWNHGAEELYGYSADEAVGKNFADLAVPPDRLSEYRVFLDRIHHGRPVKRHDNVRRRKDGSLVDISLSITPLQGPDGKVIGSSVSAYDISERKAAEEAEKAKQESQRLQEVDQKLRDFINAAAHDLNQPLTPMKMAMFAFQRSAPDMNEAARKQVAMVNRSVERMELLVQDLLDVARIEAGTLSLNLGAVRVDDLLKESKEFFTNPAETQGVTLDTKTDAVEVIADSRRVIQVLFNLVGNAMKFTNEGGTITLTARRLEDKEHTCIEVTDTGAGMTDEQMSLLFQPFSQVHTDMPNAPKGTGLGLYICKGIITQHGGEIGVRSDGPGKGSTFWFTLPLLGPVKQQGPGKEEE